MYVDGESKGNPANHEGSRAFPLAASHTWNSLPEDSAIIQAAAEDSSVQTVFR